MINCMNMSVSCFSDDLLCCEESSEIFSGESVPECSLGESSSDVEESIAGFIEHERNYVPGSDYLLRFRSTSLNVSAREYSVAWILKVQAYYRFQPLTAYLAVNYLDRFLNSRRLTITNGWLFQLSSVACLSLAAKMEEPLVPSLLDLQVEDAKYIFEARTVLRMELLVLSVLDWRLRSVTPFSFIDFFACKLDPTGTFIGFLISRATQIILSNIKETSFLEHSPSSIAAAAILCAADEVPNSSLANPEHAESWCDGLSKEKIRSCYQLMQDILVPNNNRGKPRRMLPQLRVTICGRRRSSGSESSLPWSASYKRRKLNNCLYE